MENTLQINDRVAVNKFGNFFGDVERGEIVYFVIPQVGYRQTFQNPEDPLAIDLNQLWFSLEFFLILPSNI